MSSAAKMILTVFVCFSIGLGVVGYFYFDTQEQLILRDEQNQLLSIVSSKSNQILAWRNERIGDGLYFLSDKPLVKHIRGIISNPDNGRDNEDVVQWMRVLQKAYSYRRIMLFNSGGRLLLTSDHGSDNGMSDEFHGLFDTLDKRIPVSLVDCHVTDTSVSPHFDLVVIIPADDKDGSRIAGYLVMKIDPNDYLYPALQNWPTSFKSCEALLVRREGKNVIYLNSLRYSNAKPGTLRFSIDDNSLPAAAIVRGQGGIVDGNDYRGVLVLAAGQRVPGSPWYVVAKIDQEEMYAEIVRMRYISGIALAFLLITAALGVGFVWIGQLRKYEKKQLDLERQSSELAQRYRHLTRYAHDIIFLTDSELNIEDMNEQGLREYGYTTNQLKSMSVRDLHIDGPDLNSMLDIVAAEGGLLTECVHRRADGSLFPVEVSVSLVSSEGKRYYEAIIRNITERKRNEKRSNRLNRLYEVLSGISRSMTRAQNVGELYGETCQLIVEESDLRMAWCGLIDSATGRVIPVASAGEGLGYLAAVDIDLNDPLRGHGPIGKCSVTARHVVVNTIDWERTMVPWHAVALEYGFHSIAAFPVQMGARVIGALALYSGEPDFFSDIEVALLDRISAELSFAVSYIEAELRRSEMEQQLEASEIMMRKILDNFRDVYFRTNRDGRFVLISSSVLRVYRYDSLDELIGQPAVVLYKDPGARIALMNELSKHGKVDDMVGEGVRRDGTAFWVSLSAQFVYDEKGEWQGIEGVVRDISERRETEERVRRMNDELEVRVSERTAQLESAIRELESFSYSVSHDLRAPLRHVMGFIDLLRMHLESKDETTLRYISLISDASRRLSTLIDDLLDFSRIGRRDLITMDISMQEMVDSVIREQEQMNPDRRLNWTVGKLPVISADPNLIRIVLNNLLSNAVKFTRTREIAEIEIGLESAADGMNVFFVRDNGVGFEQEYADKLFGVFQRLHSEDDFEGTGIGLAMVQRILARHGGSIRASGVVDKGAEFHFSLPMKESDKS
jgi:PAS domain S-box-containing protein